MDYDIDFGGAIPLDGQVPQAVRHRLPFVLFAPQGRATKAVAGIAEDLVGAGHATGKDSFFTRVSGWLSGGMGKASRR